MTTAAKRPGNDHPRPSAAPEPRFSPVSRWQWAAALSTHITGIGSAAAFGVVLSLPNHTSLLRTLLLTLCAACLSGMVQLAIRYRQHRQAEHSRIAALRAFQNALPAGLELTGVTQGWTLDRNEWTLQHGPRRYPLRSRRGYLEVLVLDSRSGRANRPVWEPVEQLLGVPIYPLTAEFATAHWDTDPDHTAGRSDLTAIERTLH